MIIDNNQEPIMKAAQHGGARKGAGRKPVDTVEHRVRLPRDVVSILTALGNGRLSAGIIKAARQLKIGESQAINQCDTRGGP